MTDCHVASLLAMTCGGRFFYVNILLIVKCVMKLFYVIARFCVFYVIARLRRSRGNLSL